MVETFERADGVRLRVVPGFRDAVLRARPSGTPKPSWTEADYEAAARKRVAQARQRREQIAAALGDESAQPQRGLELGCGAGLDCVLAALDGMAHVTGVDSDSPLHADGDRRERALRLVGTAARLAERPADEPPELLLQHLPVDIRPMDATALAFDDAAFDVVWSRTALEHVQPIDQALAETVRVLRPGGIAHHVVDPFYWLKGCHARGLTEMPWAHARLEPDDYERFVAQAETRGRAAKRSAFLESLNRMTLDEWRAAVEATGAFDVVAWEEHHAPVALEALDRHPDVLATTLPGVTERDLTCSAVTVVLKRRDIRVAGVSGG